GRGGSSRSGRPPRPPHRARQWAPPTERNPRRPARRREAPSIPGCCGTPGGTRPVPANVVQSPVWMMPDERNDDVLRGRPGREDDMSDRVDALVIFGATGDLAKIETFPALVGLGERDVRNVPVIGASNEALGLEQLREYAAGSLTLNNMDPGTPAAVKMLSLLRYVDGDLGDDATYRAMSEAIGPGEQVLYYLEVPPFLFGRIAQGIATAGRAAAARAARGQ